MLCARGGPSRRALYIDALERCCHQLAGNPELGRACDEVRKGLHRLEHAQHVIFYRRVPGGVLISHQRMLPSGHSIDDADE